MRRALFLSLCTVSLAAASASGDWQPVAPGIDYQAFVLGDPNRLFVTRMGRSHSACTIDSCIGRRTLAVGRETVSIMAAQHEGVIGYWGQTWGGRYDVVAAVNGDFFNLSTGAPTGGQIISGWYAKRFGDFTGGSGFAWQLDGDIFIGECVRHVANKQKVAYPGTGATQNINGINRERGADELVIYTHHYALHTSTDATGAEVLVRLARPMMILPLPSHAVGTVVDIRPNAGSTIVPFDHVVLSAQGTAATKLLSNVVLGAEIQISQEIRHYEHDCSTSLPLDWTKTYASIGGSYHFLKEGVIQTFSDPGATARHPRTAVAYNSTHVFFVVVDGRSAISVGMNMAELAGFCLSHLAATDGINQDGGGSSTMWVDGEIKNVPSDGSERPVANGLMMIVVEPKVQSMRFVTDDEVSAIVNPSVRVGPGSNHEALAVVLVGTPGVILDHPLGGVLATGSYWWQCQFGDMNGWVPESSLRDRDLVGDYDGDGDVDLADWDVFASCMLGPTQPYNPGHSCIAGDSDADLDIDLVDAAVVKHLFSTQSTR